MHKEKKSTIALVAVIPLTCYLSFCFWVFTGPKSFHPEPNTEIGYIWD